MKKRGKKGKTFDEKNSNKITFKIKLPQSLLPSQTHSSGMQIPLPQVNWWSIQVPFCCSAQVPFPRLSDPSGHLQDTCPCSRTAFNPSGQRQTDLSSGRGTQMCEQVWDEQLFWPWRWRLEKALTSMPPLMLVIMDAEPLPEIIHHIFEVQFIVFEKSYIVSINSIFRKKIKNVLNSNDFTDFSEFFDAWVTQKLRIFQYFQKSIFLIKSWFLARKFK